MLSDERKQEITSIVGRALDRAERIWNKHGLAMDEATRADSAGIIKRERVRSRIPGHSTVESGNERVDTFIALVADIRESSTHLRQAIGKPATASQLQRVFYETSALLPALERTIQYEEGSVTEYLGDGVLALFAVDGDDEKSAIYAAYEAADNCLGDTLAIVNDALGKRYHLPPLRFGIGMALGRAVVSLMGIEDNSHAKAFGMCVWDATNLADGENEIKVDEFLYCAWPTRKGGPLGFRKKKGRGDVEGYVVSRKPKEEAA
jgi:class 3 adenylate cyclase